MSIHELIKLYKDNKLALYGLGTETERFIKEYGESLSIIGLLDGYKEDGNIFGYPITSIDKAICEGISLIIVIARPGSCKAITKRIGDICRSNKRDSNYRRCKLKLPDSLYIFFCFFLIVFVCSRPDRSNGTRFFYVWKCIR